MTDAISTIGETQVVALVRATSIPDAAKLADTLMEGGIRAIEFTFTTPSVETHIAAARATDAIVGAGTVLTAAQAESALEAGAQFLVTPGLSASVAEIAHAAGVPVLMGAFTPSEVMRALELGVDGVKIFPAQTAGADYFRHLAGPLPEARLIASGGIGSDNARSFLDAGAFAVTAGSSVVPAPALAAGEWSEILARTRQFTASLKS